MEQAVADIRNSHIQKRIWRLRREGKSWSEVVSKINNEFDNSFSTLKIQEMYNEHAAMSEVVANTTKKGKIEAEKASKEWHNEINCLIELLNTKVKKYLEMADILMIESFESKDRQAFFKDLPAFNNLLRSLQDQVKLLRDTQDKIQINQSNLIFSETKILQLVNKTYADKERLSGFRIHPGKGILIPTVKG